MRYFGIFFANMQEFSKKSQRNGPDHASQGEKENTGENRVIRFIYANRTLLLGLDIGLTIGLTPSCHWIVLVICWCRFVVCIWLDPDKAVARTVVLGEIRSILNYPSDATYQVMIRRYVGHLFQCAE